MNLLEGDTVDDDEDGGTRMRTKEIPHERRITIPAACRLLNLSYNQVQRLGFKGELTMLRDDGRWYLDRREVVRRVESTESGS